MADKPQLRVRVKKPPVEEPAELAGYSSHAMVLPPPQHKGPPMTDVPVTQILAAIEGHRQGRFASAASGFQDRPGTAPQHQFEVEEIVLPASLPGDRSTAAAGDRHLFQPFTLRKEIDASTPQFYQAFATSEPLDTAIFDCYGIDKGGALVLAATVKLTDAVICSVDFDLPDIRAIKDGTVHETIRLVFEQVELTLASGAFSGRWAS